MHLLRIAVPCLFLAGCDLGLQPATPFRAELQPVGGSGVQGSSAALSAGRSSSEAGIELIGAPLTTYGWEVRSGNCAGGGTLLGGVAAFRDLTTDNLGHGSIQRIFFSAVMSSSGQYHVVALTADRGTIVACGDYVPV
jgi:hypothetical protein